MFKLAIFAALVAVALAGGYQAGLQVNHAGAVAPYNNARRQQAVNTVAHNIGRGTGTAYHDGVPGAGKVYLVNYGQHSGYGYGHGGHGGYRGYGYGGHGGYGGYGHGDSYGHGGYGYGHRGNYAGFLGGYGYGGYDNGYGHGR